MDKSASSKTAAQQKEQVSTEIVASSGQARQDLVNRKVTCPFLGPAVAAGLLPIRNDIVRPLASIDDVKRLGNSGGGDLGDLLELFAQGNHAFMAGTADKLDQQVPLGHFSLDLPGSQGSHPGHSGILQGDPDVLDSGRFNEEAYERLVSRANDGLLTRADVGALIADNLRRDPNATIFSFRESVRTFFGTLAQTVPAVLEVLSHLTSGARERPEHRELLEELTKNARASNLLGSAGEFGLLFAFLEHKPGAQTVDGEPAVSVEDLALMFKDRSLPTGWETWPKTKADWAKNTFAIAVAAHKA